MARRPLAALVLAALTVVLATPPAHGQPGYGADLPSLTGDPLDRAALNAGFNNLAVTLQMQTFLLSNPAFIAALQADAEARQQLMQQARAELHAQGESVIANGQASTRFTPQDDVSIEPEVRKLFGPRGQSTPLVPVDLQAFRTYAAQRGLATDDVADAAAITTAICYEIYAAQPDTVHDLALTELRSRARADLLADPVFQGMDDRDRQIVYEFLAVWTVAAAVDYQDFTIRLAQPGNQGLVTTRDALQHLRTTCGNLLEQSFGVPADSIHVTPSGLSVGG